MSHPSDTDKLALDGGQRTFRGTYPGGFLGADLIGQEEIDAVTEVLRARSIFRYYGPQLLCRTEQFERVFAEALGVPRALGVSSGTAALRVALAACGVGQGDEVIVPAYTFIATPGAVIGVGAVPVFADVDSSLGLDVDDVEQRITDRTRAIIPVHLQGVACDLHPLQRLARERRLLLPRTAPRPAARPATVMPSAASDTWGLSAFSRTRFRAQGKAGRCRLPTRTTTCVRGSTMTREAFAVASSSRPSTLRSASLATTSA